MKKIAVIGHGYVGDAIFKFFGNHFDTCVVDPKYTDFEAKKLEANDCDLAIVCVPTPMSEDGSVDLSFVESTLEWLTKPLVLIKSTIPPGTTDYLKEKFKTKETIEEPEYAEEVVTPRRIVFSPEYIGEGNYFIPFWKDYPHPKEMQYHSFQIMGGDRKDAREVLEYFQKVTGPEARYHVTDAKTAELCKYMENAYIATKVTFCNEFANIAEAFGVDYGELRELWLLDGRVGRMYTSVFKDARGFGGKCLPKDVNGIVQQTKKVGYQPKLIEAVLAVNKEIRKE